MQPKYSLVARIAKKELTLFFSSPIAYLFLACFALISLFIFFWGEAFFARNIADVRPLFEWMPLLLIFLGATLTMRLWSEEKRTGTLEHVLTQPVPLWQFTLGKFVACLVLLAIALAITLPIPITVSVIAHLDWGPVIAGYIATFLLGAAYLSIGLFVSARSENQIVSLISAVFVGGIFYVLGSPTITSLFGHHIAAFLQSIGSGSRFQSITRGVLDFRDLYYYLSITGLFLILNTYALEKERWSTQGDTKHHKHWQQLSLLLIVNLIFANLWLSKVTMLRIDTTQGKQYSLSQVSKNYLHHLQEPLLIRAYFSNKTHPLLAPLVPQLEDLLQEYKIAGGGNVKVDIIDPAEHPELEKEANQKYGIKPVPFKITDRYQSAIVSSYFNILVSYGDQRQAIGFNDLIEVKSQENSQNIDVQLRNPEHDITAAVKKVIEEYQSSGNLFDTVKGKITLNAYISADKNLPDTLIKFKQSVMSMAQKYKKQAGNRFTVKQFIPEDNDGKIAKQIAQDYGFQPMAMGLLSNKHFYFYLTLSNGDEIVQIPFQDVDEASLHRNFKTALQHFAHGFSKTIGIVAPKTNPQLARYGMAGAQFNQLKKFLGDDLNVKEIDISSGRVAGDIDLLMLLSPKNLDEKQLFAIDQFLMKGGTVLASTSPYSADFSAGKLAVKENNSGLEKWLTHYGLSIDKQLVLDPLNSALPVPVMRNVGGFQLREVKMLDYPYFIDIRDDGLNQHNAITSALPHISMAWASPIKLDRKKQNGRKITELLHSSEQSWLSSSTDVMPQFNQQGETIINPAGEQKSHLLGVISKGEFTSYFADKASPLLTKNDDKNKAKSEKSAIVSFSGVIKHSPKSAQIILFSSNAFLRDRVMQMSGVAQGAQDQSNSQLIANAIDWSLDEQGLMSIRSRGHFNRTLPPMKHTQQLFWEYLNYGLAIILLLFIVFAHRQRKRKQQFFYQQMLAK